MEKEKFYGLEDGTLTPASPPRGMPAPRGLTAHDVEWLVDDLIDMGNNLDVSRHTPGYIEGFRDALKLAVRRVNRLEYKRWLADGEPRKRGGDAD